MKIYKLMKSNFMTIRQDETIEAALEKMSSMKVNGAPVVDSTGKLVGMIVKADIYRFLTTPGHIDKCPVEWVMTKKVISVSVDDDLLTAARKLRDNNIIAMPVLDDETVRGMISIEDILDFYINS
jgi:CBS domain-containing protein